MAKLDPAKLKYTQDHEWVSVEGNVALVGVSEHAASLLGDIVYIELPEVGDEVTAGESFGSIETAKAVSELLVPLSGTIKEVNPAISSEADEPAYDLVTSEPLDKGWIVKIEMSDPSEQDALLSWESFLEMIKEEN